VIFAQLSVNHEFVSDYCSNMSKFTWYIWLYMFVCCWGLNCWCYLRSLDEIVKYEFLVKNEFDADFVMEW